MDWRERKYYTVKFDFGAKAMRTRYLKNIPSVKLHCPTNLISHSSRLAFTDEYEVRGNKYDYLISCKFKVSDLVEYELNKAKRNDGFCAWQEIRPRIKIDTTIKLENGNSIKFIPEKSDTIRGHRAEYPYIYFDYNDKVVNEVMKEWSKENGSI